MKARELIKVWRTKRLKTSVDEKLMRLKQFNLPKQFVLLVFKAAAPLIGLFLEKTGTTLNAKVLAKFGMWLRWQGFDRVFLIYQECESALKRGF
ncbi:hypothetical protein ACKFKF_11150 [Phormidesmis sp. 146-12]